MESLEKALEAWPKNITVAQCLVIDRYLKQNPDMKICSVNWYSINDVLWVHFDSGEAVEISKNGDMSWKE